MSGKKVVIFNLENSEIEYARYLIAHVTHIDTFKLRKPKELTPGAAALSPEFVGQPAQEAMIIPAPAAMKDE